MSDLLGRLGRKKPTDQQEEEVIRKILAEWQGPLDLGPEQIGECARSWTRALRHALTLADAPTVRVLCGFGAVADTIYRLDPQGEELKTFLRWAAGQTGGTVADLISQAQRILANTDTVKAMTQEDGAATSFAEVVALLVWCMRNEGKKPVLKTADLQRRMIQYVDWRRQQANPGVMSDSLGGASGNMCYVLRHLGLAVVAHWPYHHGSIAAQAPPCLTRLVARPAAAQDDVPADRGRDRDPVRRSVSFEYPEGSTFTVQRTGKEVIAQAAKPGRAIFQVPTFRSQDRPWNQIELRVPTRGAGWETLTVVRDDVTAQLDHDGWPFLPLFADWHLDHETLVIEVTPDAVMEDIGRRIDYFILAGGHALGQPLMGVHLYAEGVKGPLLRSVVKHHLIRQLQVLAACGVVIHTELPAMKPEVFDEVSDVIRGRVRSVGLNDDDLLQVTSKDEHRGTRLFCDPLDSLEADPRKRHLAVLRRSRRAGHLAAQLDVDQVYVHGNDVDVIRRRGVPRGAFWRELDANLLAKAAVVLALNQRAQRASTAYGPMLTSQGMLAFLQFAADLAQEQCPHDARERRLRFKEICDAKLVFERPGDAYSTVVTPVFWPDSPPEITAGAGDMTSSVVAVFAGK